MRILIAEDDFVARKVLRIFLEKSNYEVQPVDDGTSALKALLSPDAPQIAILDWMMPGLSGPQVCTKLRLANLKIRPYLLMLSARTDKQDVAAALDAGADDYLSKPFNPVELLARLRVAERTIHYELELQKHIVDLEALAQRYNLLGEMIAQQSGSVPESDNATTSVEMTPSPAVDRPAVGLTAGEIDTILLRTFLELGLGEAKATMVPAAGAYRAASFTAWAPLVLVQEEVWVDLLLEADPLAAAAIVERALRRRASSDREITSVLAETLTIISAALRASLQAKGGEVLSPILSRALRTDSLHKPPPVPVEREPHFYALKDFSLGLTVVREKCPAKLKTAGQLHESDILAQPFRSPEAADMLLLNKGVILNERFIEKLSTIAQTQLKGLQLPVFQPSSLAFYF